MILPEHRANGPLRIAITGATGYIGRATVHAALRNGLEVVTLGRRPIEHSQAQFACYRLEDRGPIDCLDSCSAVIHLAADTAARSRAAVDLETGAATRLIEECQRYGVHLIYASSQTADPNASSGYARSKWAVEQLVHRAGGGVIRPGLVYGGAERGLFGDLCRFARRLPLLPAFHPAPQVQPIHVDDLAAGLLRAAETRMRGTWMLGSEQPVSFNGFLRWLVRVRVRRTRFFVPVPAALVLAVSPLLTRLTGGAADFGQLRSLYATASMQTAADMKAAGIEGRPLRVGLRRGSNGHRHALLSEARTVLSYVLRAPVPSSLLRRYVRAIEALDQGRMLDLPSSVSKHPLALALLESRSSDRGSRLATRISWAARIAEASPQGSLRYQPPSSYRPARAATRVVWALAGEAFSRLLRAVLWPAVNRAMRTLERDPP